MSRATLLCVVAPAIILLCGADTLLDPESAKSPDDVQGNFKGPVDSAVNPIVPNDAPGSVKSPDDTPGSPKTPGEVRENQLESDILHHFQHLTYVADCVCREPQPRVVPVDRLLPSSVTWDKAYYPDVTVLHLCEDSGACSSGFRCGPSHVTSVHLPFKVTYLEDVEYHKKGSWAFEFHLMENHTHCACAEEPVTERPRPMPVPLPLQPLTSPATPAVIVKPAPSYNPSFNPLPGPNPSFSNTIPGPNPSFSNNAPSPITPPLPPPLSSIAPVGPSNSGPRTQEFLSPSPN